MNSNLKKIIATALATGGIVSGSFAAANKLQCDHTMVIQGEDYCVQEEVYREIQSGLKPNSGFGGVNFSGNENYTVWELCPDGKTTKSSISGEKILEFDCEDVGIRKVKEWTFFEYESRGDVSPKG